MSWCENPQCSKQDLRKDEIEFDRELKLILCNECFAARHPGWVPPVQVIDYTTPTPPIQKEFQYDISLHSRDGFKARFSFGDTTLGFHAPIEVVNRWLR